MAKRKEIEREEQDNKNNKIRVVSRIEDLNKAPEQVLKLLIYHQQKRMDQIQEKFDKLEQRINNSNIWLCNLCYTYEGKNEENKCDLCEKIMCERCYDKHNCKELKCIFCEKEIEIEINTDDMMMINQYFIYDRCDNCLEICCNKNCIEKHLDICK